jgi:hypothetical protein
MSFSMLLAFSFSLSPFRQFWAYCCAMNCAAQSSSARFRIGNTAYTYKRMSNK